MHELSKNQISISIIIPVLKEGEKIVELLDHLKKIQGNRFLEIIVVDGDEKGGTIQYLQDRNAVSTLRSPKGRARQMNNGAAKAQCDILLFLHADTFIPDNAFEQIDSVCQKDKYVGGAFDLGFDNHKWSFKLIAKIASLRSRITRIPFGDQAVFVKRSYFEKIGGFQDIPLMEDIDLMRRIKKNGGKVWIIPQKVTTSSRKWEEEGILYATLRNWRLQLLYLGGVSSEKLVHYYYKKEDT